MLPLYVRYETFRSIHARNKVLKRVLTPSISKVVQSRTMIADLERELDFAQEEDLKPVYAYLRHCVARTGKRGRGRSPFRFTCGISRSCINVSWYNCSCPGKGELLLLLLLLRWWWLIMMRRLRRRLRRGMLLDLLLGRRRGLRCML